MNHKNKNNEATVKKYYRKPKISVYGNIQEITKSGAMVDMADDDPSMGMNNKT